MLDHRYFFFFFFPCLLIIEENCRVGDKAALDYSAIMALKKKRLCHARLLPPMGHIHQAAQSAPWRGAWNQHLIPPATPRPRVTHERTHTHARAYSHTHSVTGLVVGLNPHGSRGPPTALCRTSEIIPVRADSHRMLILNHLFYCAVKSGSSSQSLLPLRIPSFLYPSLSILSFNPPQIPGSVLFLSSAFNSILSPPKIS